ncbi:hypothetical protein [Streptomyces stelliscabiei]|uniref:Uncharacterized protein n=1 Tax=Streptomyces stelliscabiei TaxID=146820 RepID=A0A8I0P8B0_9ACTN|nr:hypothetical protein [Streptomyces stelliscabiei]KND45771.1 hypothetical protein IQ64_04920 [Streptomyces stelliscabiei]MBE1598004.1 hypothetical protein [Streptomyces stelliscabiei]MDX2515512.1 hypothetical protein [Streptomyces stelliscabiei]MDX2552110.1 hypothetical protein [Streptomyces stelliscabiei]MDX2609522.1 hypothetical protein [Streptomyces stelliscabiei]
MLNAVSGGHDPTYQLQTSVLTLIFGMALISVGWMLRRTGRLPAYLDIGQKALGSLVPQGGKSAGVGRLGAAMIAVGGFFLIGTACLALGALGVLGP